jgi:hypothetical protein
VNGAAALGAATGATGANVGGAGILEGDTITGTGATTTTGAVTGATGVGTTKGTATGAITGAGAGAGAITGAGAGATTSATACFVSCGNASISDWITLVLAIMACAIIWIVESFIQFIFLTSYRFLNCETAINERLDEFAQNFAWFSELRSLTHEHGSGL